MVPPFDLQGGVPLALARGAAVAAMLSVFGTLAFRILVAPRAFARMAEQDASRIKFRLLLLSQASIAAALCALAVWLGVQAAVMADADTLRETLAAIPTVLRKTFFGHVIVCQAAALLLLVPVIDRRDTAPRQRAAFAASFAVILLQAAHSHAWSMYGGASFLLAADILHLLGAGAWLGGLVPLIMLVWMAPPKAGATAARYFSPLGKWCIAALLVSAAFQAWVLVATIPGLIGTAYGWLILAKTMLFSVLLGFAAANRYRFAPALLHNNPSSARRVLIRSIMLQSGFAVAIVLAAAILSGLPPSMHEQPLWPFAQRFSLSAINEDADFRREVLAAGVALAAAVTLVLAAMALRRFRIAAIAAAGVICWFALPHLDLLLVPAYPTSFFRSPTGFSVAAITDGEALFAQNCVACHGQGGHGDGPLAKTLATPPADLTAAHLWMHSDGELFWWISHGMLTPEGEQAMPGFAGELGDDARWALIDYIRARNAGDAKRDATDWPRPVKAANFGVKCGDRVLQLSDFRGGFVRLVFAAMPNGAASATGAATILVSPPPGPVWQGACIARDETISPAYAILSGVAPGDVAGMQVLIDPDGWLRALQPAGSADHWDNPPALAAEIKVLRDHKVADPGAASEPMKMPM